MRMEASSQASARLVTALTFSGILTPGRYLQYQYRVFKSNKLLDVLVLSVDNFREFPTIDELFMDPEPDIRVNPVSELLHIFPNDFSNL